VADKFRYSKIPQDEDVVRLQRETEDNFFSKNKNGDLVSDKDIHCRSIYVEGDSLYIGGMKIIAPTHSEDGAFWQYDRTNNEMIFGTSIAAAAHAASHESGGADTVDHDSLIGYVANEHLPAIDEDAMGSDSDVHVPTQQSVKKYVDDSLIGAGGDMTYIYVNALAQAEGDLHLSDVTNWNENKARILNIRLITASTNWELWLLQNDNGYAADDAAIPMTQLMANGNGNLTIDLNQAYEDEDATNEVHLYWASASGVDTADIYVEGVTLV